MSEEIELDAGDHNAAGSVPGYDGMYWSAVRHEAKRRIRMERFESFVEAEMARQLAEGET